MFINVAYATETAAQAESMAPTGVAAFLANPLVMIVVMMVLFYVLLIMPQQKRFKEHREMINSLKKGDKVVTSGGLVGKVHEVKDGDDEVVVDLGDVKVTALRNTIQQKEDPADLKAKNDNKK